MYRIKNNAKKIQNTDVISNWSTQAHAPWCISECHINLHCQQIFPESIWFWSEGRYIGSMFQPPSHNITWIVHSNTTSCKSLGHTTEAVGTARQHQFVMMDYLLLWFKELRVCFWASLQMMSVIFAHHTPERIGQSQWVKYHPSMY